LIFLTKRKSPPQIVKKHKHYKCKHFSIEELVPKELYDNTKDKESLWELFNKDLLKDLDTIKETFNKGTITINSWKWGGNRNWSGYRTPDSPYYRVSSLHNTGNAFDLIFSDYNPEEVRKYIAEHREKFPAIKGLEHKLKGKLINWVHLDSKDRGHLLFNA